MRSKLNRRLKKYRYSTAIPFGMMALDFAMILLIMELFIWQQPPKDENLERYASLGLSMAMCWILVASATRVYDVYNMNSYKKIILKSAITAFLYLTVMILFVRLRAYGQVRLSLTAGLCFFAVSVITIAKMLLLWMYLTFRPTKFSRKNTVIIGNTRRAKEMARYFLMRNLPNFYLGYFDTHLPSSPHDQQYYIGSLEEITDYCLLHNVHEIYYAIDNQVDLYRALSEFTDANFIFLGVIPDIEGMDFTRRIDTLLYNDSKIPVISSRRIPLQSVANTNVKRVFDICFSFLALTFLSFTIFPIIALAIKIESRGPIFFCQLRPGRNNKLFVCYKFRTMRHNSAQQIQATKNDIRITKVGAVLRKTSLDELPQFYNALKGDMSIVGPRPNLIVHLEQYSKEIKEYHLRHWVTPGITGYAQINGLRGETKDSLLMQRRVDHDLQYIENWSLSFDLQIIGKTVINMIKGEDSAY